MSAPMSMGIAFGIIFHRLKPSVMLQKENVVKGYNSQKIFKASSYTSLIENLSMELMQRHLHWAFRNFSKFIESFETQKHNTEEHQEGNTLTFWLLSHSGDLFMSGRELKNSISVNAENVHYFSTWTSRSHASCNRQESSRAFWQHSVSIYPRNR